MREGCCALTELIFSFVALKCHLVEEPVENFVENWLCLVIFCYVKGELLTDGHLL